MATFAPALRADLRVRLVNRDFEGIEVQHFEWLHRTVPTEFRDRVELRQQVTCFCLEAIEMFDPDWDAKFTTFLTHHLRLRCGNYQQYLWIRGSGNKNRRMLPLIQRRQVENNSDDAGLDTTNDVVYDAGGDTNDNLCIDSRIESMASVNELLEALSEEARDYMNYLLGHEDQETLVAAFKTKHFRSKVAMITGLSKRQIEIVANEVRRKFLDHLDAE